MKIISNVNQYLLERYPTIWNTKIVWMFFIASFIHILFFIYGYFSHSNPLDLQNHYVLEFYFTGGAVFVNFIISILLLVGWLTSLFKNNAFKNFYPTSNLKIFGQFLQYLFIIFISITFYLSYMFGFKTYINQKYTDESLLNNIEIINKAYPFLSQNPELYTIDELYYPKKISSLYCELDKNKIDYSKKYFTYYDNHYQFYEVTEIEVTKKDSLGRYLYPNGYDNDYSLAYTDYQDKLAIFYFKKEVVDIEKYTTVTNLSYLNFSNVFYQIGLNTYSDKSYVDFKSRFENTTKIEQNKKVHDLLKKNDKDALKEVLSQFLSISKNYKIDTNLNISDWLDLVYHPENNFKVTKFILESNPKKGEIEFIENSTVVSDNFALDADTNEDPQYRLRIQNFEKNKTKFYYNNNDLKRFLDNVYEVKNSDILSTYFPIFLLVSYIFATILLAYRISNVRLFLFSIVASGLIALFIGFTWLLMSFLFVFTYSEIICFYYILIVGFIVYMISKSRKVSSFIRGLAVNITINAMILYVFMVYLIINLHLKINCYKAINILENYKECKNIDHYISNQLSFYLVIFIATICVLFYIPQIRKWKSTPK